MVSRAQHPCSHSVTSKDTSYRVQNYIFYINVNNSLKSILKQVNTHLPTPENQTWCSVEISILKRFLLEGGFQCISLSNWGSIYLSEHNSPDMGAGRAEKCSGTHAELISRYISAQPYWLPRPFDQARRGLYYLKRLTAWAQWQVCREENNSQKQMQGRVTNMSATTMHVRRGASPPGKKKDRKRKDIYFHEANFHAKLNICLAFVFGINRTYTHSRIMSKVQRVESWEFSRGWINEVCRLAGLHSALHEVSPWGPGDVWLWFSALVLP